MYSDPVEQVSHHGRGRSEPALAGLQLARSHRHQTVDEAAPVRHVADRVHPGRAGLDDEQLACLEAPGPASQLEGEPLHTTHRTEGDATGSLCFDAGQERDIGGCRRPQRQIGRSRRRRRPGRDHRSGRQIDPVDVAELAVVPGDPADHLPEVSSGAAPRVDHRELGPYQATTTVTGVSGDQLRLTDGHRHPSVRPRLRDQEQRRHDPAGGRVFDDGDVTFGAERRMRKLEQVARPSPTAPPRARPHRQASRR